jgi:hypothetical protein
MNFLALRADSGILVVNLFFVGFTWPDLISPSIRFCFGDQAGAEQINPALLLPFSVLIAPISTDDPLRAFLQRRVDAKRAKRKNRYGGDSGASGIGTQWKWYNLKTL